MMTMMLAGWMMTAATTTDENLQLHLSPLFFQSRRLFFHLPAQGCQACRLRYFRLEMLGRNFCCAGA